MRFETDTNFITLCNVLRDQANQCLLLAGAGMTMACHGGWTGTRENPATWLGLLLNGAQFVAERVDPALGTRLEAELRTFEALPNGADKEERRAAVYGAVGEGIWLSLEHAALLDPWLRESIGALSVGDLGREILQQIGRLRIGGVSLVTTNYEDFLAGELKCTPVTHLDRAELAAVFAGNNPDKIGHVHGHYGQPDSIVLTERQYCILVEREDGAHLGLKMAKVHRYWIFVGCGAGLGDPNFGRMLRWLPDYLPPELQTPCFYIGTQTDWDQVKGLPSFDRLDIRHVPLDAYAELLPALTALAGAVSLGELQEFGPNIAPIRVRLRTADAGADDIRPSWQELCDGALPRNPDDTLVYATALHDQRVLLIASAAGSGKSTIGMQLACDAQQRGEPVYWLQMDAETRLTPAARHLLAGLDGLVVIDEAQNNYNLTLEILHLAVRRGGKLRAVTLATKGKTTGFDDIDAGTVVADLHRAGVEVRQHEPRASVAFYRALGQFLLRRAGKPRLAERIDDAIADSWRREFRKQVYMFAAALLGSAAHLPSTWDGQLQIAAAGAWVRRRFGIDDRMPRRSLEVLAYFALIAKSKDGSYGWIPELALPHPLAVLDQRARPLLISTSRPGLTGPVYRLTQSDALGQLLWDVLGPDLQQFAQDYDRDDPRALAGRLLMAPQEIGRLAERYAHLSVEQMTAPLFDYRDAFDARLASLSLRIYSTLIAFLADSDKAIARRFIEAGDPHWFDIDALIDRPTMDGAGSLANNLYKCGQAEAGLESAFAGLAGNLSRAIVLRAAPEQDFITTQFNLLHLGEVLRSLPADIDGAERFIRAVWRPAWIQNAVLRGKLTHFPETVLNGGRTPNAEVADHFRRRDLHSAYAGTLAHLIRLARDDLGVFAIFQTLGPLYLFGARSADNFLREGVALNWLRGLDGPRLIRAIEGNVWTEQATHNPAFGPGRYQVKAWLGLRAGLELAGGQLRIDAAVIRQRLALLQGRIDGAPDPDCQITPTTAIDRSMVKWLEHCLRWQEDGRVPLDGRDRGLRALRDELWTLPCRQPRAAA